MFTPIRSLLRAFTRALSRSDSNNVQSRMIGNGSLIVRAWPVGTTPGAFPVARSLPLPFLTHLEELGPTRWLQESLTTFGASVASFLPGHFAAYARVYHPFDTTGSDGVQSSSSWHQLPELAGCDIRDPLAVLRIVDGLTNAQANTGSPTRPIVETLVEHLRMATTTPEDCYFAVWHGFGGLAVPEDSMPRLILPHREYHVFTGPVIAAQTSYDAYTFGHHEHFANLWWPADHAWCVATEVDSAWTHVGASRACIDALLADTRLETLETSAHATW